ncbi:unnamed protein product [Peniophora sp. CBMAI 1063]|nr:unnamed protein product [Peniophora sp. CBMAI 1063]
MADSSYNFSSSHNTRNLIHSSAIRHGTRTPGDRLAAAAFPRPAKKRKTVEYEPDFGDGGDVWQKADGRSIKRKGSPTQLHRGGQQQQAGVSSVSSAPRETFAGVLDNLSPEVIVNAHGFPLNDDDVERLARERVDEPTSQGKVSFIFGSYHLTLLMRKAWLRDAGVSVRLCPNADAKGDCPHGAKRVPDFAALDAGEPPAYGGFSAPARPTGGGAMSGAVPGDMWTAPDVDDEVNRQTFVRGLDEGELEGTEVLPGPTEADEFQPLGPADDGDVEGGHEMPVGDAGEPGVVRQAGKSAIPTKDMYGFKTIIVVHTDSIHGVGVSFCRCPGAPAAHEQLLQYGGLFPASQEDPATAFTLQGLEHRLVDDVVCKTSSLAHMRKLRRCTEPHEPRLAPNRYHELNLVSRQYSAVQNLIDFGYATQPLTTWKDPPPGGLVWKCIVCPRKTLEFNNVPRKWEEDPDEWRLFVSMCYDGNFSGDHTISKRPGNNVPFYAGTGFFNHPDIVAEHMKHAVDDKALKRILPDLDKEERPCHQHRAAANVGKIRSKVVDIKGIGSWACSRHGCLCANGTNNFDLGEAYVPYPLTRIRGLPNGDASSHPVDLSLSKAFEHTITGGIRRAQLLYDIWCRYGVHLKRRFHHSRLEWPDFRELLQGVGVWHIYGHVFDCYRRYAPVYSPRAGIVDGEILETLWALLNAILQSCRGMSLAAREEKINLHMNDVNHGKIIRMGPDSKDVEARLIEEETRSSPATSIVRSIITSLDLEEDGLKMQARGSEWGTSASERRTAAIARSRFDNRRTKANQEMQAMLGGERLVDEDLLSPKLSRILPEDEWDTDEHTGHGYNLRPLAEFKPVDTLSSRPDERRSKDRTTALERRAMDAELELRMARLDARIQSVMEGVVDQAQSYRLQLRQNKSKGKNSNNYVARSRAWLHTRQQNKDVRVHASIYNHGAKRLARLFWDDSEEAQNRKNSILAKYRPITADDIKCTTATYDMYNNTRTQGKFQLPWFWRTFRSNRPVGSCDNEGGDEVLDDDTFIGAFFRTRWINARCSYVRCEEEVFMLEGEMQTCYLGYRALADAWEEKYRRLPTTPEGQHDPYAGHRAHALETRHAWLDLAAKAKAAFNAEVENVVVATLQ